MIIRSDKIIVIATDESKTNIIKLLEAIIEDIKEEIDANYTRNSRKSNYKSLYTKDDILKKFDGVIALHKAKLAANNTKYADMQELQKAADNCNDIDCNNCVLDNIVENYDLFANKNLPLLEEVRRRINALPYGAFLGVRISADILIKTIKAAINARV